MNHPTGDVYPPSHDELREQLVRIQISIEATEWGKYIVRYIRWKIHTYSMPCKEHPRTRWRDDQPWSVQQRSICPDLQNRSEERSAGLSKILHEMKGVRKTRRTVQRNHRSSSRRFQLRLSDGILQVRNELFDMGHGQPLN